MTKYKAGQISNEKDPPCNGTYCCFHKNIVPLEIGFASKTWPNGIKAEPNYDFSVNILSANTIRVKTYICLDCKQEIKAPNPGSMKKDRL